MQKKEVMAFTSNKTIFPDHKLGPLTSYRVKSSFDYRKLKIIIEDQATLELRQKIWDFMELHPDFARSTKQLDLDNTRKEAARRMFIIFNEKFYDLEQVRAFV